MSYRSNSLGSPIDSETAEKMIKEGAIRRAVYSYRCVIDQARSEILEGAVLRFSARWNSRINEQSSGRDITIKRADELVDLLSKDEISNLNLEVIRKDGTFFGCWSLYMDWMK